MNTDRKRGFTLIELVIVSALILLVMGLAMPALLPAFAFSELEGAARHLSSFGRSSAAYASLNGEYITVKVDLDAGEYWAVELVDTTSTLFDESEEEPEVDEQDALAALVASQSDGGTVLAEEAMLMEQRFERFFRRTLEAQAKNVRHDGSLFDEVEPLFEDAFSLRDEGEDEDREINDVLMRRTVLPAEVFFESMMVGSVEHTKGIVEIEVSPLGLTDTVTFYLLRGENRYYTIVWDPITGGSRLTRGKVEPVGQAETL